ncbi:MAG: acyl-CoA/acyl-ACP dehydrogenase [Deltaproteobacteria bacterium]|nr:acyl-CoA/acyl-ACP dehydrogenase [Deltaproteobacteria bacterium]
MDFSLTEEQRALSALAAQIIGDRCAPERLKAIEASGAGYDGELWAELAKAGLLGAALPEAAGGSGGGFVESCLLLEQQGRRVVMLPLLPALVSAAMPLARFGSSEQQRRYLPGVVAGSTLLTAALSEVTADSRSPATVATAEGDHWRLTGVKVAVPLAQQAAAVLVPARTAGGEIAVFIVDPQAAGVTLARQETMNWEAHSRLELSAVKVGRESVLGSIGQGAAILDWIVDRTTAGLCAIASGACQEALLLTAQYASNRKQFDKPIAMFQAVGQRMADAYIDNEAVNLTMWQAATRLADEMPSAKEIATAKYWAAEGGSRIGHAGLHVHGGISIDVDYPMHRYFLWLKQIEYTLGAATPQLAQLGALIAAAPL